jgi:hypothetical protein
VKTARSRKVNEPFCALSSSYKTKLRKVSAPALSSRYRDFLRIWLKHAGDVPLNQIATDSLRAFLICHRLAEGGRIDQQAVTQALIDIIADGPDVRKKMQRSISPRSI